MEAILKKENIIINLAKTTKEEAIKFAGEKLVALGYVAEAFIQSMLNREKIVSTYMGNFLAIPHGEDGAAKFVKKPGIVIHHYKDAIDFGEPVHFVIGLAALDGDSHLDILASIAETFSDLETVEKLLNNISVAALYNTILKEE